jgi:large subunit ribosomal protein L21
MYAIVNIAGQQFKVEKDQQIIVNRLEGEEGKSIKFSDVVLIDDKGKVKMGAESLKNDSISAKIISHLRGDKVIIFHKKRRKGYEKLNGHRQDLTRIQIEEITA